MVTPPRNPDAHSEILHDHECGSGLGNIAIRMVPHRLLIPRERRQPLKKDVLLTADAVAVPCSPSE